MSEKPSSHHISSTDLRKKLGHWLDEAVQGKEVVVSRRGKPEVVLEAVQKCLLLEGLPKNSVKEFYSLLNQLKPEDLAVVIRQVRSMVERYLDDPVE
jgi:prevent-host-death family protein